MSAVTEVIIDPNVRVAGNETFAGFEDIRGAMPDKGWRVIVREPESNLVGYGRVTRLDDADRLIYLAVNWAELVPERILSPEELMQLSRGAVPAGIPTFAGAARSVACGPAPSQAQREWRSNRDHALTA
jgi:hypothetical protein